MGWKCRECRETESNREGKAKEIKIRRNSEQIFYNLKLSLVFALDMAVRQMLEPKAIQYLLLHRIGAAVLSPGHFSQRDQIASAAGSGMPALSTPIPALQWGKQRALRGPQSQITEQAW